jgi:probable F420-dependent oxidoreductase
MLDLAAERTNGAHTYLVTPEHTTKARAQLGPAPWLVVEQAVVLESDPAAARAIGRRHVARYLDLPNYTNNFLRIGFTSEDIANRGSDRLVDGLVAWGDLDAIAARVNDHLVAGADQVCVQIFDADPHALPLRQWREIAGLGLPGHDYQIGSLVAAGKPASSWCGGAAQQSQPSRWARVAQGRTLTRR